jgi:hypothetical protein
MANYFVIGADSKEYGPVSTEELGKWAAQGRADAQTKVRAEGATDWVPLAQVPELAAALKSTAPPPLPAGAAPTGGKTSGLAVASLVLGLLPCGITSLFGLICGIMALGKISKNPGALRGKGLALTGTILSAVFLIMVPFLVLPALLLPALAAAKQKAMMINCMNNEKQLAIAMKIYAADNHDHLPPAATWCDAITNEAGSDKIYKCPAANSSSRCDYAFNAKLEGLDPGKVDPQTVMIFESDSGWNAHGGPQLAASTRHGAGHNIRTVVAFADGHAEVVTQTRFNSLRWDP